MDQDQLPHFIAAALLLSRIADMGSTWLATPRLKLEANPLVRRFRWPYAALTLCVFVIPYWQLGPGITLTVASLLVSAGNFGRVWVMRAAGEDEYHAFMSRLAARASARMAYACIGASALCMASVGAVMLLFYPNPQQDWAYWFALGFIGYGLAIAAWGSVAFRRLRRAGQAA